MSRRDDVIRASEIGQYAYCARAWWLRRVKDYRSTNVAAMRQGTIRHRTHGRAVEGYHLLRWIAVGLLVLATGVLLVWLALGVGG